MSFSQECQPRKDAQNEMINFFPYLLLMYSE